jgi:hypothetical protein
MFFDGVDPKRLLAQGSLTVVRVPRPGSTFVLSTGHCVEWRYLEGHFRPQGWWTWAGLAVATRPFRIPRLADWVAGYGVRQRTTDDGTVCVFTAEPDGSYSRVVIPNEKVLETVASDLGLDIQVRQNSQRMPALPFTLSIQDTLYFDSSKRHCSDKSG